MSEVVRLSTTPDVETSVTHEVIYLMESFFDTPYNPDVVAALMEPQSRQQREVLSCERAEDVIVHVLEATQLLPKKLPPLPEQAAVEEKAERTKHNSQVTNLRKPVIDIISIGASYYRSEAFWDDLNQKSPRIKIDTLEALHERTNFYAKQSPIHELLAEIHMQNSSSQSVADALRIVKILLLSEREPAGTELP